MWLEGVPQFYKGQSKKTLAGWVSIVGARTRPCDHLQLQGPSSRASHCPGCHAAHNSRMIHECWAGTLGFVSCGYGMRGFPYPEEVHGSVGVHFCCLRKHLSRYQVIRRFEMDWGTILFMYIIVSAQSGWNQCNSCLSQLPEILHSLFLVNATAFNGLEVISGWGAWHCAFGTELLPGSRKDVVKTHTLCLNWKRDIIFTIMNMKICKIARRAALGVKCWSCSKAERLCGHKENSWPVV